MRPRGRSDAILVVLLLLAPFLAAPSGLGEHGCDCGSQGTNPPPITGYGPAYGPIAVGATVAIDPSGQLVSGDAFEIPAPGTLHALKVGAATVRFQSSVGPKDVDYSALVADAIDVDPAWCPGGVLPCLVGVDSAVVGKIPFKLYAGGKAGTFVEAGDLCPFAATSPVRLLCDFAPGTNTVAFTIDAAATGSITTPFDPSVQLDIAGIALSMVDTLEMTFAPVQGNPTGVIGVLATAKTGGQLLAIDVFQRHLTLDTASQLQGCQLTNVGQGSSFDFTGMGPGPFELEIVGTKSATCTVRAELVGTTVAAMGQHVF